MLLWNYFENVDVKTYVRTNTAGNRIGFIAQDIQQQLPPQFGNLISTQYGGDEPLLAVDYSRLVWVLWGVCKQLQSRIDALETPPAKKTTAPKEKKTKATSST